ncbi:MAG TPA: pantoate--beta-alanine ligase [Desulfobulbus sp.]|nr:pantoate--beta-alanine ligase [Desulfobulbus sp.]
MEILTSPGAMRAWSREQRVLGKKIALVPTMGFFHQGHLSLMRMAARHGDAVVVSLFVNPIQFGPNEDLDRYPRSFTKDCELAGQEGVAVVFAPEAADMYPAGFQTTVSVEQLSRSLCGADRPGHFNGVTTVVSKLFHLVQPDMAVFGQKDFQQLSIIRRMVRDLDMGIEILAHPIVREPDGLAMSSRNVYLNEQQRRSALSLSGGIALARSLYTDGLLDTAVLKEKVREHILSYPGTAVDYISFVDRSSLEPVDRADQETLLALAVSIDGRVRLIDNGLLVGTG